MRASPAGEGSRHESPSRREGIVRLITMKRLLKTLSVVFLVALLTQTPFIYRRYQLGRLNAKIQELESARVADADPVYADHKGAIHVHSFLGGHSEGTFADIIEAARSNGLAFVVMTEHPSGDYDTRALTLRGVRGGVLFVPGNETSESAPDRFLTFGGTAVGDASPAGSTQGIIDRARAAGQLVFVAHPETFRSWREASGFDGMEIYNLHANAKDINRPLLFFDGLWSYRSYPHLLWTRFYQSPEANLRRFDELTAGGHKIVAIAGNDAHANVGLAFRDLAGHTLFAVKLDPYERIFQVVRTHVLVERGQPLNEENLLSALKRGHAYIAFDILCDASGFRFTATNGAEQKFAEQKLMGDEIALTGAGVRLRVTTPVRSRIQIIGNGRVVSEARDVSSHEWTTNEAGVYRVVCYLPQLPAPLDAKPWIISNPVYVR